MTQEHPSSERRARAHLGRVVLDELASRAPAPAPDLATLEEARELRGDDLAAARELALVYAHRATLSERVRAAVAADRAPVILEDGSRLSRDETERVLASKEEKRAFAPLRRSLERAAAPARDRRDNAHERFHEVLLEVLEHPREEVPVADDAAAALNRFLADVKDAAQEARSALAREGRVSLEDPAALARGLDLPDPEGFADGGIRRLGRALLESAGEHQQRAVKAVRAPRSLAGVVIAADEGPVRTATCPSCSAGRFLALSGGLGNSVALSLLEAGELEPLFEDQALVFGAALTFGFSAAVARVAALEEPAGIAERRARVLAATRLVRLQLQAYAALVLLDGEGRDALREILAGVLGTDPPGALLDDLVAPPWPGLTHLRGPAAAAGAAVLRASLGAAAAAALRDRYDEAFALVPSSYELFGGAREALIGGAVGVLDLVGASFDVEHPGRALVEWTSEML